MSRRGCGKRLRAIAVRYLCRRVLRCCVTRRIGTRQQRREATAVLVQDLVLPNDAGVVGTDEQERLACVRRTVLGVLYADDAGIVSEVG